MENKMQNRQGLGSKWFSILLIFSALITLSKSATCNPPDEGMYPISQIPAQKLKEAGLNIDMDKIFNLDSVSLLNAIVRIGGCTGSFVSPEGLILTNHHCVFSSLKPHSKEGQNYMETGFVANTNSEELPMKGIEVKIMRDYEDVSDIILDGITNNMQPVEKKKAINDNINDLQQKRQEANPDFKIEVSEMLVGKSYILFKYQMLKDLRLVYVPPRNVGEFGGATDNWEWPRHTGDFSFVRAYTGPNGEPAEYSEDNIPFKPDEFLQINRNGVEKEDFVFILGYPGRTSRHKPSEFLRFMEEVQLPWIEENFQWRIDQLHELTSQKEKWKIKYDPKIKRLQNTAKNYRGKMIGIEAIDLYKKRKAEEQEIAQKLRKMNPELYERFRSNLSKTDRLYDEVIKRGDKIFWYSQAYRMSEALLISRFLGELKIEIQRMKDSGEDWKEFEVNANLRKAIEGSYKKVDELIDTTYLRYMLSEAQDYSGSNELAGFENVFPEEDFNENLNELITELYESDIMDSSVIMPLLRQKPYKLIKEDHPLIELWINTREDFLETDSIRRTSFDGVDALQPEYVSLKMKVKGETFVPDANGTLRLTYGHIKGYWQRDAVYMQPFTGLEGYREKASMDKEDYTAMPELVSAIDNLNAEGFLMKEINDVPLCMIYNTDTSGGNSGSPILDANGQLIGLNFDRTFKATINDYAWDDDYSRSIGVDVRFILWYAETIGDAEYLLEEMGVS